MDPYIQRLENKALKHLVVDGSGRVGIDHADAIKKADYYIGSWLIAKRPVDVLSAPNGKIIATRNAGQQVGRIYSFVNSNGNLWWQLYGTGGGNGGFVKHAVGAFDNEIALDSSSGKEHDEKMQALENIDKESIAGKVQTAIGDVVKGTGDVASGLGKTLTGLGNNLTLVLIIGMVLIIAFTSFKFLKA